MSSAVLHHVCYHNGDVAESLDVEKTLVLLHGIYGSARNWNGFARRLSSEHPERGFIAVDLRLHGESQVANPPHTVLACAQDLIDLEQQLECRFTDISGHSFGGKVALTFADQRARWGRGALETVWIQDSDPSDASHRLTTDAAPSSAIGVLRVLRKLPSIEFASRGEFRSVLGSHGIARPTADWLGMNLRRTQDGLRLQMDVPALGDLLSDYLQLDLWPLLEELEVTRGVHFVIGGRSSVVPRSNQERLAPLDFADRKLTCDVLEEAGHRLHVDDPDGLSALFGKYL